MGNGERQQVSGNSLDHSAVEAAHFGGKLPTETHNVTGNFCTCLEPCVCVRCDCAFCLLWLFCDKSFAKWSRKLICQGYNHRVIATHWHFSQITPNGFEPGPCGSGEGQHCQSWLQRIRPLGVRGISCTNEYTNTQLHTLSHYN